jgi:hypothetical protein
MLYPWPLADADVALEDALCIAMRYLQQAGLCDDFANVERKAASVILCHWRAGVKHPIYLANKAIVAVEKGECTVHILHPGDGWVS